MQSTLQWHGLETGSLENCSYTTNEQDLIIDSTIVGVRERVPFRVSYTLTLSVDWKMKHLALDSLIDDNEHSIRLQRNAGGHWFQNGDAMPQFTGVDYLDITLTPLTNSLPINHLHLRVNEFAIIDVVYIDVFANTIKRLQQQYTRIGPFDYRFENVPNDFEARISVDEAGFVTKYPGLFERVS